MTVVAADYACAQRAEGLDIPGTTEGAPELESRTNAGARVAEPPDRKVRSARWVQPLLKRTLDVAVSAAILLGLLPVMLVVAAAILIDSPGPVFYRADRVGRGGRRIRMYKFRKMRRDAGGLRLTTGDDDRLTRVGAFLTRSKLDELPQLINVLRGDMSVVGPRPEDPGFVLERRQDYDHILRVRPGITGYSQIAFADESRILSDEDPLTHYRERIFPQKCALDRLYVESLGARTDVRIVAWTAVAVVLRRQVAVDRTTGRMGLRRREARAPSGSIVGPALLGGFVSTTPRRGTAAHDVQVRISGGVASAPDLPAGRRVV